jgi:hypothetical protein
MDVVQSLKGFSHPKLHRRPTYKDRPAFSGSYFNHSISFLRSGYFTVGRKCTSPYFIDSKTSETKTSSLITTQ